MAKPDTAHHTLVLEGVNQINVKYTRHFWIKDRKPIRFHLLLMCWQTLEIQLRQCIANAELRMLRGTRVSNLGRRSCSWVGRVWDRLIQLRCGRSARSTVQNAPILIRTRRGGLRRLRVPIRWSRISTWLERRLLLWGRTLKTRWRWRGLWHSMLGRTVLIRLRGWRRKTRRTI